jgi:hypothetical protein
VGFGAGVGFATGFALQGVATPCWVGDFFGASFFTTGFATGCLATGFATTFGVGFTTGFVAGFTTFFTTGLEAGFATVFGATAFFSVLLGFSLTESVLLFLGVAFGVGVFFVAIESNILKINQNPTAHY